jgi:uncharacterized protein
MDISEVIKELNSRIKEKYSDFKGSYLYGSRARGDYREDSDVDVVVLFEEMNADKEMELHGICIDLDYKYDIVISLQPYTLERLEKNYVYHDEVVNKGIYFDVA